MNQPWPESVYIYTDGASRGNPGPSSLGISIVDPSTESEIFYWGEPLGLQTNNYAEYFAVIRALELARDQGVQQLEVRSDSQLLIRQILGEYKVKNEGLKPLFTQVKSLERGFKACAWRHIPREQNKRADELANQALDRGELLRS